MRHSILASCILFVTFGLAGCGGGGGGGGGGTTGLTMSLSTNTLTFEGMNGISNAPPTQDVTATMTGTAAGTLFVLISTSNPDVATVTNVFIDQVNDTGRGVVRAGLPTPLGVGTHTATLTVRACLNDSTCATGQVTGSPQTVTVTYNVNGIRTTPPNVAFNIGNSSQPADSTQSITITGRPAFSWTAADDAPWLTLTPVNGSTSADVAMLATLVQNVVDSLRNGTHTATITLTPGIGTTVTVPVTLTLQRSVVNYVAPYVATSNTSAEVIVRGDGFTALAPAGVTFGGNPAAAFNVVSDTEIRATHPALNAGVYDVRLMTAQGPFANSRAQLQVVDAPVFASAALAHPAYPASPGAPVFVNDLIYDAERRALLATILHNGGSEPIEARGRVVRYAYGSGAWGAPLAVPAQYHHAAALTTDGSKLLVGYDDRSNFRFALAELDPVTLTETRLTRYLNEELEADSIAVANDGRAIINTGRSCCSGIFPVLSYTPLSGVLEEMRQDTQINRSIHSAFVGASGDGSTVLLPNGDPSGVPVPRTFRYNSNLGRIEPAEPGVPASVIRMGRRGNRILFAGGTSGPTIHGSNLALLGSLPNSVSTLAALSPDERRAYTYDSGNATLHVFDLESTPVSGVFPELPAIAVGNDPGYLYAMTITPDGGTMFLGGSQQIVVVPLD